MKYLKYDGVIPEGYKLVYARYIVKNGRIIYPTNAKVFVFLAKDE